jgi:hypothetical protein
MLDWYNTDDVDICIYFTEVTQSSLYRGFYIVKDVLVIGLYELLDNPTT